MFALSQQVSAVLVEEWNKFFAGQGMQFLEIKDTGIQAGIILKNIIDFKKLDITEFDLYQAGIYESNPHKLLADLVEDLRKIDYDEHVLEKEGSKILLNKFEIAVASALVLGAVCLAILHVMLPGLILLELGVAASLTAEVALIGLTAAFATGAAGKAAYDEIKEHLPNSEHSKNIVKLTQKVAESSAKASEKIDSFIGLAELIKDRAADKEVEPVVKYR